MSCQEMQNIVWIIILLMISAWLIALNPIAATYSFIPTKGLGKLTSENSLFTNLSKRDLEKILEDEQSNKTKKNTNWCVSTFKGEFQI